MLPGYWLHNVGMLLMVARMRQLLVVGIGELLVVSVGRIRVRQMGRVNCCVPRRIVTGGDVA